MQGIDKNDDKYLFIHYAYVSYIPIAIKAFMSV